MKTLSEIAHEKNEKSMDELVNFLTTYKVSFSSKNMFINNKKLDTLKEDAISVNKRMKKLINKYCELLIEREKCFSLLPSITSNEEIKQDSYLLLKKIQRFQVFDKNKLNNVINEAKDTGKYVKEVDNNDRKYFYAIEQLEQLIKQLKNSNHNLLPQLKTIHQKITLAYHNLRENRREIIKARTGRYNIIYKTDYGLIDVAHDTKVHIKKTYGKDSKEWQIVSGIEFKQLK